MGDKELLEVLGGEPGCRRLAEDFYSRVATSPELKPLFPGKTVRCATEEFAAFLIQFLGGDEDQTQQRWWLSLSESHARFKISERQRAAWLGLMDETLHSLVGEPETREALGRFFRVASVYIVGNGDEELEPGELEQRWSRQRALDQVIGAIAHGRDAEAISLSRQFAARTVVFTGILARMIQTAREPLIAFVLESVENDNRLAESRFNGRTLLHFAASHSCLSVVRLSLSIGVDPDVLDAGGHTPLYRVASVGTADHGGMIVDALIQAGATVDHAGGVTKSTALHQAARFGDLQVAKALINAGARPTLRDKKGLTPLDRAINCRRRDVAELLASR
jgi:hemoglobin